MRLSYGQKIFLLATLPLLFAAAAIALVVSYQSRDLAEREIAALESQLIETKKGELQNYLSIARTAFVNVYGRAAPDDEASQLAVSQELSAMLYGQDGFFFVFDYDGNNLVAPRKTELIGKNWAGLTDPRGTAITDQLIETARSGGGYHTFEWTKPSTGEMAPFIAYVVGLQDWKWVIGTGIFVDDVQAAVARQRADVEARIFETFLYIAGITLLALLLVFASGVVINVRERRLADTKLKALTQRIFDTQEEERGRVARELHDGISQILVGVRYTLELAGRRFKSADAKGEAALSKGIESLNEAIGEVRAISRDLRPGVLDDLGLGPALQALTDDFSGRTGIQTQFETVVFRNRLDQEAKTALYRIAQEALTNIARHAEATHVRVEVKGHRSGATLRITDNGIGMDRSSRETDRRGLGLRNMAERVEQLEGTLRIFSSKTGTTIEAQVPLTHMLAPESPAAPLKKDTA
ncbi:MAG: cache domain-containing protein [Pseudomonadota bacterium]